MFFKRIYFRITKKKKYERLQNPKKMETKLMVEVRRYTSKQLRLLMKAKKTFFYQDLKAIRPLLGKKHGNYWSIEQVELIMQHMGRPYILITV